MPKNLVRMLRHLRAPLSTLRSILVSGVVLSVMAGALLAARSPSTSNAAAVNCGSHWASSGWFGSIELISYITAYGDPACSGSRYRAFEYVAVTYPATYIDWIGFEQSIGVRAWECGTQKYGGYGGAGNVPGIAAWADWSEFGYSSCGHQADQNVKFAEAGYPDVWRYKSY